MVRENLREAMVIRLKEQAANRLTDPDSVEFRRLVLFNKRIDSIPADVDQGSFTLCGELNARNRLGGYVGYTPFLSTIFINGETGKAEPSASYAELSDGDGESANGAFHSLYLKMCTGTGISVDNTK